MTEQLHGRAIAFLATDGVEQIELTDPWQAVLKADGQPCLVSLAPGTIQGFDHHDKADRFPVDRTVADAHAADFAGLILPGGVINPDLLRMDPRAVAFVKEFIDLEKPVAAICHGPWTLVEADGVAGTTLTSWPSLQTDLRNAGATWVDQTVCVDGHLITSRMPQDLPDFCAAALHAFAQQAVVSPR